MEDGVYVVYWSSGGSICAASLKGPSYNDQYILNRETPIPSVNKFLAGLKEIMSAVQHPGKSHQSSVQFFLFYQRVNHLLIADWNSFVIDSICI